MSQRLGPLSRSSGSCGRRKRRTGFVSAVYKAEAPVEEAGGTGFVENLHVELIADLGVKDDSDTGALLKRLIELGSSSPEFVLPQHELTEEKRVPGCASRVWIDCEVREEDSLVHFRGYSDSAISKGMCNLLCRNFSGKLTPESFLSIDESFLKEVTRGLGPVLSSSHRRHGLFSIFDSMRKRVHQLVSGGIDEPFPSLVITKEDLIPQGKYAESQATYLKPDQSKVDDLVRSLKETKCGVVAHFYMDPEVQGVLAAAQKDWPHIHISDSLVMADRAVDMAAEGGCENICVLGVDFMSENVRATLDHQGYNDVNVYRMDVDLIGCTLAEAAESERYERYLEEAARATENALHVVYINTSLKTKAVAQSKVPTITCTSSNVVQTILQSSSQLDGDLSVFYGPDAYMGANIKEMLEQLCGTSDEEVRKIHKDHDISSIKNLLSRFRYYQDGICLVHDMFGSEVAQTIRESYADAFCTAHFEVPGEMFKLALHASHNGDRGVIGSTKNILDFILGKVAEANEHNLESERLQFILGTESGMITSVVNAVQESLREAGSNVEVEIVFPVNSSAITSASQANAPAMPFGLDIVPGPAGGEGCSMEGGCASCPYMKINSLDALMFVLSKLEEDDSDPILQDYAPRNYEESIDGKSFAQVGTVPILHMRHFTQHKCMSDDLVADIKARGLQ
ncbi:quinolinate synthase [Chloropicon primus]|uniref:quinolinate synthase n=1 Tax=Chloropicon primus TaxID=1764295 RepID=A0A5B8MZH6_9CHLO|nr:quinolinate synthase [Chloropicon primus]|eukprot:QDZ26067.1 quinolinate synthase [Chloropicon primus]